MYKKLIILLLVLGTFGLFTSPSLVVYGQDDSSSPDVIVVDDGNKGGENDEIVTPDAFNDGHWGRWSNWASCGSPCTRYFAPNRTGYHAIQFISDYNVYHWGTVTMYWRNGGGSWNKFNTSDVMSYYRNKTLYSGSPEINYKFVFTGYTGKAHFRFFTD